MANKKTLHSFTNHKIRILKEHPEYDSNMLTVGDNNLLFNVYLRETNYEFEQFMIRYLQRKKEER